MRYGFIRLILLIIHVLIFSTTLFFICVLEKLRSCRLFPWAWIFFAQKKLLIFFFFVEVVLDKDFLVHSSFLSSSKKFLNWNEGCSAKYRVLFYMILNFCSPYNKSLFIIDSFSQFNDCNNIINTVDLLRGYIIMFGYFKANFSYL